MIVDEESIHRSRHKSWWKHKTKVERHLIFGLIIAILLIIALAISTAVTALSGARKPCLTGTCIQVAASLLVRTNSSMDPCEDFYEFACGRYAAETEIPDDKMEVDSLSLIGSLVNAQVKQVITEPPQPYEIRPFRMLKKLYSACINTTAIKEENLEKMKSIFNSLGGWPILRQSDWIEENWIDITRKLRQHGFSTAHFITVDVDINPKNSSEYILTIDQAENEEIGEDNLKEGLTSNLVRVYANYLIQLAVIFGANKEFATKEIHDVIEFRAKIAELLASKSEHYKLIVSANETNIAGLQQKYPGIEWIDFINGALAFPNTTITPKDKVLMVTQNYIEQFEGLINKTPKRVQVNHALLQVLRSMVHYLPKSIRDKEQEFMGSVTGTTRSLPRWDICVTKSSESFHLATDALYVRKFVDESARSDVTEMVSHIKKAFIKMLKEVDWMDNSTKQQAIEKGEGITPQIAYPTELRSDKEIEEYYGGIKFDSDNLLDLITEASKYKRDKMLQFYGTPVVKNHWTTRLPTITSNAIYDPQSNSIQIPSGIMQNEFYNKDRPKYMNYGSLGLVIGHELTHGFDNNGKTFDKNGNVANWWAESTNTAFSLKAKCYVEQYSNFTVPEIKLNINGENTLGENIADNGGIKAAYLAYSEWAKQHEEEPLLPGISYSQRQLFWISLANSWCGKSRASALEQAVLGDEHSPNRYRILGGFSNSPEFSMDFNCPVGSKMNPMRKCQIW